MSVEMYKGSHRKLDSRTLNRKTLNRWTGRTVKCFFDSETPFPRVSVRVDFECFATLRLFESKGVRTVHIYIYIYIYTHTVN